MTIQRRSARTAAAVPSAEMDGPVGPFRHREAQSNFLHRSALGRSLGLRRVVSLCLVCIFGGTAQPRPAVGKMLHRHGIK